MNDENQKMMDGAQPVTEDDLHRLVDGRLPRSEAWALEARIALDPQARARLLAWRAQLAPAACRDPG